MSRPEYVVTTQAELDAAIRDHGDESCAIWVDSDPGVCLRIMESGRLADLVVGSASVVEVGGSARVGWVGGSASVGWVGGSARVVEVGGSARVGRASGKAVLALYDRAAVELAGKHVCVYLHSALATVQGGHLIDLTSLDLRDVDQWIDYTGAETDGDDVLLYKAVDDAGHSYRLTAYQLGATVTAPDWRDDHDCGGGLHASPSPAQARAYYESASRMLVVAASRASLRTIGADKAKAPTLRVVREVALDGACGCDA